MAWHGTILSFCRPLPYGNRIDNLAAAFISGAGMARTAYPSLGTQVSNQLSFERSPSLYEQASIDRLV